MATSSDLRTALAAVWSGPLQELWDQQASGRGRGASAVDVLLGVMDEVRAKAAARKRSCAAARLSQGLRVLVSARLERRKVRLAARARDRSARDSSPWAEAHEALSERATPAAVSTLAELLAALKAKADGGGRIVEGEAESLRSAAAADVDASDEEEEDDDDGAGERVVGAGAKPAPPTSSRFAMSSLAMEPDAGGEAGWGDEVDLDLGVGERRRAAEERREQRRRQREEQGGGTREKPSRGLRVAATKVSE